MLNNYNSFIYKKFLNSLMKQGKKIKTENILKNFYYNLNSIIFYGYWYNLKPDLSKRLRRRFKDEISFFKKRSIYSSEQMANSRKLLLHKSDNNFKYSLKNVFYKFDFFKNNFNSSNSSFNYNRSSALKFFSLEDYIRKIFWNFFFFFLSPKILFEKKKIKTKLKKNIFFFIDKINEKKKMFKKKSINFFSFIINGNSNKKKGKYKNYKKFFVITKNFFKYLKFNLKIVIKKKKKIIKSFYKNMLKDYLFFLLRSSRFAKLKKLVFFFKYYKILNLSIKNKKKKLFSKFLKSDKISKKIIFRTFRKGKKRYYRQSKKINSNEVSVLKNISKIAYYYYSFSRMPHNFFVSNFLIFQIIYSLTPYLGVRMTAVQSTTALKKKKGGRKKSYGVPIILSPVSQIICAIGFFKKSFKGFLSKSKSLKNYSFKNSLNDELTNFLFLKNTVSLGFKKDLYKKILEYRSNFHFRWIAFRKSKFKTKKNLLDKKNILL